MTSVNPHQHVIDAGIVPSVLSKLSFIGDKLTRTAQDAMRLGGREVVTVALALTGAAAMVAPGVAQAQQQPWEVALQQQQQKFEKDMQRQRQSQALQTGVQIAGQAMGATSTESSLARLAGELAGAATSNSNSARNASAGAQLLSLGAAHFMRDKQPQQQQYQPQYSNNSFQQQYQPQYSNNSFQQQQNAQNNPLYVRFSQMVQPAYSAAINHHMDGNYAARDDAAVNYFNIVCRAATAGAVFQPADHAAIQNMANVAPEVSSRFLVPNHQGQARLNCSR
jgi:hypothetical protein